MSKAEEWAEMLPEYVRDHPMIGLRVRCKSDEFQGVIESVLRFEGGAEYFQIQRGSLGRGGLEREDFDIVVDADKK